MRETARDCADDDGVANMQLLAQESTMRAKAEAAKLRRQQVCASVWVWAGVGRGWCVHVYAVCLCRRT